MGTNLIVHVNKGDPDVSYGESGADYLALDIAHDYLIWTKGSDDVKAGQNEPTEAELNVASTIISAVAETQVAHCLCYDYNENKLEEVEGMGGNKKYVFCFRFDGDTANEPQIEAWDTNGHTTYNKHVLGNGTPADSFVKGKCTTTLLPGTNWAKTGGSHTELAGDGSSNVIKLNDGNGAVVLPSGITHKELYANLAIVIPVGYATPGIEPFNLCVRYTWN